MTRRFPALPAALLFALIAAAASPSGAEEYLGQRGYRFLTRGANPLAVHYFRSAQETYPEMAGPLAGMALAECRLRRDLDAAEHLTAARALDPGDPLVLAAEACRSSRDGDLGLSKEQLGAAWDASRIPFHGREYAQFLLHQGELVEAEGVLLEMMDLGWSDDRVRAMLAQVQLADGLTAQSLATVDGILDRRPRSAVADYLLQLHTLAGGPAGPRRLDPRARLVTWASGNDLVLAHAELLRREGWLDEAELVAGRRRVDPQDPVSRSILARLSVDLGDTAGADGYLADAQQRWPVNPSVLLTAAYVAASSGDTAGAREALVLAQERGVPPWDLAFVREVEGLLPEGR